MRKFLVVMFLLAFAFCAGCEEKVKDSNSSAIDVNREPEVLIFDTHKNDPEPAEETGASSQLVLHPDMKGDSKIDEAMSYTENLKEDAELNVTVLSKYADTRYFHLYLSIKNEGKGGKHVNLYIFHYDKAGRLVRTEQRGKYVAPLETWVYYSRYGNNTSTARWVFKATRRK